MHVEIKQLVAQNVDFRLQILHSDHIASFLGSLEVILRNSKAEIFDFFVQLLYSTRAWPARFSRYFLRTAWIRLKLHGSFFFHRSTDNCSSDQFAVFVAWNEPWPQQIPSFNSFTDFSALTRIACVNSQIHSLKKTELINGKRAERSSSNEHQQQQTGNTERQRLIFDGLWSRWCWQSAVYRQSITGHSHRSQFIFHFTCRSHCRRLLTLLSPFCSLIVNGQFFPSPSYTRLLVRWMLRLKRFYILLLAVAHRSSHLALNKQAGKKRTLCWHDHKKKLTDTSNDDRAVAASTSHHTLCEFINECQKKQKHKAANVES